jgi:murein DD-endopeptidase MepM/ murein hydrolase activator NlpD
VAAATHALLLESPIEVRRHAALGLMLPALLVPTVGARDVPAPVEAEPLLVSASRVDVSVRSLAALVPSITPPLAHPDDLAARPPEVRPDGWNAPIEGEIRPRETLAGALAARGVARSTVRTITKQLSAMMDVRRVRPGDRFTLRLERDGGLVEFEYRVAARELYRVATKDGRLVAERRGGEIVRRTARIAGVVGTTLYDAIDDLGESPQLAKDFAEIFAYDVDFARGLQRGDEFRILYERLYRTDVEGREHYLRPGRIQAAHFEGRSGSHTAVYFEHDDRHGAYYRTDGTPVRKSFLIAPLKYERMTSGYTSARFHPILGVTRPHLGIDYAAPEGTPLWAVGDGKVVHLGRFGGFGNLVKIQHPNGYVSYYSHLSRYAAGLKVGDTVRQKQVIGFVGSTGLATGAHVCFRIQKPSGEYVNPAQVSAEGLTGASLARHRGFRETRDSLLAGLRSSELVAVGEAL